jgi:peptidoglycan/LPS O-acetylase OafA/YrhL
MSVRSPVQSLTGLRCVAALSVAIPHALLQIVRFPINQPVWYDYVNAASGIGMTLFFVLSGFVIHYNYSESIRAGRVRGLFNFFVARFARLYPMYILCLVGALLAAKLHGTGHHLTAALPYYLTMMQSSVYAVIGDNSLIYQYGLMMPVTWSISTEWVFYIAYPAVCFVILGLPGFRSKLAAGVALCAAVYLALFLIFTNYQTINQFAVTTFGPVADINANWQDCFIRWLVYFSPYSRISEFVAGCLAAAIFMELQGRPVTRMEGKIGALVLIAALVGIGVLYRAMFGPPYSGPPFKFVTFLHMSFGFAPLVAIVIFCCARYHSWLSTILSLPLMVRCGDVSYSVYLLHLVVIRAFVMVAVPVTSFSAEILDLAYVGVIVLVTMGFSLATYHMWESPMRRIVRRALEVGPRKMVGLPSTAD